MTRSFHVAEKLKQFLVEIQKSPSLSPQAPYPLRKDLIYIEKCIDTLSQDTDGVNALWREVQYLSRFFGEGYADGDAGRQLRRLMDEFHSTLLDDIVAIRNNPHP